MYDLLRKIPRKTILIGDINIPTVDWTTGQAIGAGGKDLLEVVQEEELEQLVLFPTHNKGNTLDLIKTNMASSIVSVYDDGKLGRSDHCIIVTEVSVINLVRKMKKKSPNWNKADYVGLRAHWQDKTGTE